MEKTKPKIGILRGLMPRLTQAEFAKSFYKFEPTFITGEASSEVNKFSQDEGLEQIDLKLKPLWGIEPIKAFLGRRTHQSWVGVAGLAKVCRGLNVLETYELYHLFSGQAAEVVRELKIPLVCEVWTSFIHPAYYIPPYSLMVKKVKDSADLFVARSRKAAEALGRIGIRDERIKVIYHGVNLRRFKKEKDARSDKLRALYVGELSKNKGIKMLLDIWPEVLESNSGARLWLVGRGPLLESAKEVKGVKVFGWVEHAELPQIYNKADLFVSPSQDRCFGPFLWWEEFFSYTLMEAQASALPIIATKSGGIPEEVGEGNWLVTQRNPKALKAAILEALSDKKALKEIGQKNRKRAEEIFSLEKQTRKLEDEILKLL